LFDLQSYIRWELIPNIFPIRGKISTKGSPPN
jgi:hypothetical protein